MITLNIMSRPVDQSWTIEKIAREARPITWEAVFEDAMNELIDVSQILEEDEKTYGSFYPQKKDIFSAFHYTTLNNVKVVIIGQDPYHQSVYINGKTVPRATGLSFSVRQEDSIPSSLQNIYTELSNSVRGFRKPDHGDLREWARQGVLLLNTCLTVRPGKPGSHGDIWLGFINKVFKAIAIANPYCIFLLWGRDAQKIKPMLGEKSVILEAAHPSGLSARRGFFGCNHFNLVNESLLHQGKIGINWRISTFDEINNIPKSGTSTAATTSTLYQSNLIPINVDMLPSILTSKPPINTPLPTIIPASPNKPQQSLPIIPNTKFTRPPLPIIPNTKNSKPPSPVTKPSNNKSSTPTRTIVPDPIPSDIPSIPIITFGKDLSTSPIIYINPVQRVSPPPILPPKRPSSDTPIMIGLPIINPVI